MQSINHSKPVTPRRRWGTPNRCLRCDGRPSTPVLCNAEQWWHRLARLLLDVVLPRLTRSTYATPSVHGALQYDLAFSSLNPNLELNRRWTDTWISLDVSRNWVPFLGSSIRISQTVLQDPDASYDVNDHDPDPQPRYDYSNENRFTFCLNSFFIILMANIEIQ